jgi:predicted Zn-dependent protease with MMP-like domain
MKATFAIIAVATAVTAAALSGVASARLLLAAALTVGVTGAIAMPLVERRSHWGGGGEQWSLPEDQFEDLVEEVERAGHAEPMDDSAFAALVRDAIDELPEWVQAELEANVAVVIADDGGRPRDYGVFGHERIWGLYQASQEGREGARIVIFRDQLTLAIRDPDELRRQVGITLRHEIAHHFGADEDRVRELGL